jgi:uncharacterized membrane protein YccC
VSRDITWTVAVYFVSILVGVSVVFMLVLTATPEFEGPGFLVIAVGAGVGILIGNIVERQRLRWIGRRELDALERATASLRAPTRMLVERTAERLATIDEPSVDIWIRSRPQRDAAMRSWPRWLPGRD